MSKQVVEIINVWEITLLYDKESDYILTDDGHIVESLVHDVAESWMDTCPKPGEEFQITIKAKEMTRQEYEAKR